MTKDYKALTDEELLNFDDAHTATMDRYRRIMQHRGNEALMQVAKQLGGVAETVYRASQGLQGKADEVINRADQFVQRTGELIHRADEAIESARSAARQQRRHQWVMVALTVVLAASTVCYTVINWRSTHEAFIANQIQSRIAATAAEQTQIAREQIAIAKESNELQRKAVPSGNQPSGGSAKP